MDKKITLNIVDKDVGKRLDRFVCNSLEGNAGRDLISALSRTFVKKLIEEKSILVNKNPTKPSYKLKYSDEILIKVPKLIELKAEGEDIPLEVVYEDDDVVVVNKEQGMITHPASGHYSHTLVNALLYHCKGSLSGINGVLRPGIVHRLDKETSGLIIACKNNKSHNEIAKQIKDRTLKRSYLAIVHGDIKYLYGTINKPIGRDKFHRQKMTVIDGGRTAITHWKVLKKLEGYTFIECSLETGRTHQIRVHMLSIGHPIVGDIMYGKKNDSITTMMLHAYKLVFIHPRTKKEIKLETKIPERFKTKPFLSLTTY